MKRTVAMRRMRACLSWTALPAAGMAEVDYTVLFTIVPRLMQACEFEHQMPLGGARAEPGIRHDRCADSPARVFPTGRGQRCLRGGCEAGTRTTQSGGPQAMQGGDSGWGLSHGWQDPGRPRLGSEGSGTAYDARHGRSHGSWTGQEVDSACLQASASAAQSESLWTLGRTDAEEALAPNQKSAGKDSSSPLSSRMFMTSLELSSGKEAHTTAAIDEATAVATELPVSAVVYREARGHGTTAFSA